MFVQIRWKSLFNAVAKYGKQRRYSISTTVNTGETAVAQDTAEPVEYPTIEDLSYKVRRKRKRQVWHDKIKGLETVEEKLLELNMPRYYGWNSLILKEHSIPYDSLRYAQYITRTHVTKEPGLPVHYNNVITGEQLDSLVQAIKNSVEDDIVFEHCIRRREHKISPKDVNYKEELDNMISKVLIQKINRTMLVHLSSKYPHLLHAEVDQEPRSEASWFMGIEPPPNVKKIFSRFENIKEYADEPIDMPVQYLGQPVIHLRHRLPLKEIIPLNECENPALDVPAFKFNPIVLGFPLARRHVTTIPGFWPGDQNEFGLMSYHNCTYLQNRPKEYDDTSEALTTQAVLASYSWLLSQACYQGFSTFNDITYPLTTQTVITNGQWWSFFVYQLNTTLVHSEQVDENPKRNVCWITEPIKLYDTIENEKVHGLNEDVLRTLIKFYANSPEERTGVDMKPYLGKSVKVIADIEHDERRNWLEQRYKHLMCNRPRHRRIPEIYAWQKIYQIYFNTRPMDKKREPWEHGINIFNKRRLDDHHPQYIPKILREDPKKKKVGRWAKTYYP